MYHTTNCCVDPAGVVGIAAVGLAKHLGDTVDFCGMDLLLKLGLTGSSVPLGRAELDDTRAVLHADRHTEPVGGVGASLHVTFFLIIFGTL